MTIAQKIDYYMNLEYTYIINQVNDESGTYFYARVLELDGCQSHGDTFEEAYENLRDAMLGWIELKIKDKEDIPLPKSADTFSGKFVIRMPKTLHQKLVIEAEKEGVSLNQLALYKLAL